jgi:hypothetical protein
MQREIRYCITDAGADIKKPIRRHLKGVAIASLAAFTTLLTIDYGHAQVSQRPAPTLLPPARANQSPEPLRARSPAPKPVCPLLGGVECGGDRGRCNRESGQCRCYAGFRGVACQYNNTINCSDQGVAQQNGTCGCVMGVAGYACRQCAKDHYSWPTCRYCLASTTCGGHGRCNSDGQCDCNSGFSGEDCSIRNR